MEALEALGRFFKTEPGSVGDSDICLGGELNPTFKAMGSATKEARRTALGLSPTKHIIAAISNVEDCLERNFNGESRQRSI